MFKKPLWQTVWTQISLLIGAVCSGFTMFASILNLSVMLGSYLQQTTFSDAFFFLGALRVKLKTVGKKVFKVLQCKMHIANFITVVCFSEKINSF